MTIKPLFDLGQTLATPGALKALDVNGIDYLTLLNRHITGDWGDLTEEDKQANDNALKCGEGRLFSAYVANGVKFWVITESDRSVTTILLPEEY